jgi:hypothetical protein
MKRKITKTEFDALHVEVQKVYSQDGDNYQLQVEGYESPNEELARLRKANVEVTAKAKERKAKIEELESNVASLQTKMKEAEYARHEALIAIPLKRMAATVSPVPVLFLSEFQKFFNVEPDNDGNLCVLTLDGKRATDRNDRPVEFTPNGLWTLLASDAILFGSKDERSKMFAHLMNYFGPSGAAGANTGPSSSTREQTQKTATVSFGLR